MSCVVLIRPTDRECIAMGVTTCWQPNIEKLRMVRTRLQDLNFADRTQAYCLHADGELGISAELEARILARLPLARVAEQMGMSLDLVRWYDALFFDVRDRFHRTSWVLAPAIGMDPTSGSLPANRMAMAKFFAFLWGEPALNRLLLM